MKRRAVRTDNTLTLLTYGFRPFFLGGAIWAVMAMLLWVGIVAGRIKIDLGLPQISWHAHEFLFGYVGAIIAGFLLTAVPNWTGRAPLQGFVLLSLLVLWIAGRVALLAAGLVDYWVAAFVDVLFLPSLALFLLREVRAAGSNANIRIVAVVLVLALANVLFHTEIIVYGYTTFAGRGSISLILLLIVLIGGRIVPNFTRNWLAGRGEHRLPAPMDGFDHTVIGISVASLIMWTFFPSMPLTPLFLLTAGVFHAVRLGRWSGWRTRSEPLVFILHMGYAFVSFGFLLAGVSLIWPSIVMPSTATHAWTSGAMGTMTLAIMTRATRGHSGRSLTAPRTTQIVYLCIILAGVLRLGEACLPDASMTLYVLSALSWVAAFSTFLMIYGPMLVLPRR